MYIHWKKQIETKFDLTFTPLRGGESFAMLCNTTSECRPVLAHTVRQHIEAAHAADGTVETLAVDPLKVRVIYDSQMEIIASGNIIDKLGVLMTGRMFDPRAKSMSERLLARAETRYRLEKSDFDVEAALAKLGK